MCINMCIYIYIYIYTHISIEKMRRGLRRIEKLRGPGSLPRSPSRSGLGHFSALIPCPDRFPARVWGTFRPDPLPRPTALAPRQAKTVNLGPDPLPRPTTLAPRQAKTANLGPDPLPRPPAQALRAAQDRQHRPQERPKTASIGPKSGPRPPTEATRTT